MEAGGAAAGGAARTGQVSDISLGQRIDARELVRLDRHIERPLQCMGDDGYLIRADLGIQAAWPSSDLVVETSRPAVSHHLPTYLPC